MGKGIREGRKNIRKVSTIKIISFLFFLGVLVLLLTIFLWIYLHPDRSFSENENRILTGKPTFSIADFLSTDYQEKLESSLQDQMPGRDILMEIATMLKKYSGRREIDGTYLGRNGRYFEKVTEEDISITRYQKNLERIDKLAADHPDITCSAMFIPESGVILSKDLPADAPMYDAASFEQMAQNTLSHYNVVPLMDAMTNAENIEELYYKTDHHWTMQGAYFAYQIWKEMLGENTKKEQEERIFEQVTDSFYGSLYSRTLDKDAYPDSISLLKDIPQTTVFADRKPIALYENDALDKKDKYQVYLGGNHGYVEIQGGQGEGTIVILKDSFANCFAPLLLEDYACILLIDLRYFPGNVDNILEDSHVKDLLVLYELHNFATDPALSRLTMQ